MKQTLVISKKTSTKTTTKKKSVFKKFHNIAAGLFGIVVDKSTNYEDSSEYVALMRRRDEILAYKVKVGYDEKMQKELEGINKRLQELVK